MMIVLVIALFFALVGWFVTVQTLRSEIRRRDEKITLLEGEVEERDRLHSNFKKDQKKERKAQQRRIYDLEERVGKADFRLAHLLLDRLDSDTFDRDHLDNVRFLFGTPKAS